MNLSVERRGLYQHLSKVTVVRMLAVFSVGMESLLGKEAQLSACQSLR
jgi:hypothetical protein